MHENYIHDCGFHWGGWRESRNRKEGTRASVLSVIFYFLWKGDLRHVWYNATI